MATRKRKRN